VSFEGIDWSVFRISLYVGVVAALICIAVGTPVAWWISRMRPAWASVFSALALLPLVLPPTAVGYYVLYVLGRQSPVGRFLIDDLGIRLVFTWPGAAIAAAIVALPLYIRTAQAGFEQVDRDMLAVAGTMAGPWRVFFRVAVPLAWPGLLAATLIAFARGLGEFGAAVIVAANIPGETQTVAVAIYDAVQAGNDALAHGLALLSLGMGLAVLTLLALVFRRGYR
jgi:molybdate transport system permease protein